jgi:hypothetical protein
MFAAAILKLAELPPDAKDERVKARHRMAAALNGPQASRSDGT